MVFTILGDADYTGKTQKPTKNCRPDYDDCMYKEKIPFNLASAHCFSSNARSNAPINCTMFLFVT